MIRVEIRRRAIDGIKRPIMYKGEQCRDEKGELMFLTEYSDSLLLALTKAHCLEFSDRLEIDHKSTPPSPTLRVVFVYPKTGEEHTQEELNRHKEGVN